jgi:hypothetical protein
VLLFFGAAAVWGSHWSYADSKVLLLLLLLLLLLPLTSHVPGSRG